MAGEPLDDFPTLRHVADIVDDRKRAAALQIGVVMRGIRGQHHRAALGLHPHHLQAVGMAADPMHGHAGGDLAIAGMKGDALAIDMAHHQRDMLDRKRMPEHAGAHAAPGRVAHLAILQMEPRMRKTVEIAGVIVMQMADDNVPDAVGLDAKAFQRIDRIERELAISQSRLFGVEAGIDQDVAAAAPDQPDEIVEILRGGLMRIRNEKIQVRRAGRHRRIAEGVDFVGVSHRLHFSCLLIGRPPHQAIVTRKGQTRRPLRRMDENQPRHPAEGWGMPADPSPLPM